MTRDVDEELSMRQPTRYGSLALTLGVASVPALFVFFLGLPLAVAAIATGAVGVVRDRSQPGRAVAGIVLGVIALVCAVVLVARPDS
jgi:uncharacterized membrane protein HdeD (DUF308 family)